MAFGLMFFSCVCHKLGCFKRKTLEYYQEQEEALQAGNPLLEDDEVKGGTKPSDTKEGLD